MASWLHKSGSVDYLVEGETWQVDWYGERCSSEFSESLDNIRRLRRVKVNAEQDVASDIQRQLVAGRDTHDDMIPGLSICRHPGRHLGPDDALDGLGEECQVVGVEGAQDESLEAVVRGAVGRAERLAEQTRERARSGLRQRAVAGRYHAAHVLRPDDDDCRPPEQVCPKDGAVLCDARPEVATTLHTILQVNCRNLNRLHRFLLLHRLNDRCVVS